MNKGRYTGLGSTSLILVFSVLCLAVFSLLTLSLVNRENTLTQKFKASVENYYSADSMAVETAVKLRNALSDGKIPAKINGIAIHSDSSGSYSFACPIDKEHSIAVRLKQEAETLKILSWQKTNTADWRPEERLGIWSGKDVP
ncbi:MAG: hypothetical protein GXY01_04980 [Clostridiales bacterium]|jgi:hypothetical protein|nr:hypothetical protein [Clostridiales bacterium]